MLETKFSKSQRKWDEYLAVCEKLGKEPDYDKMPMDDGNFPYEVQLALLVHSVLPDRWDGMSGSYLGKDWSALGTLLNVYNIEDKKTVSFFLKNIDMLQTRSINDEMEKERKRRDSQGNKFVQKATI